MVSLPDLAHEQFVLWPRDSHFHKQVLQLCHEAGFEPIVAHEADPGVLHSLVGLVAGGMGVSIIAGAVRAWASNSVVCKPLAGCKDRALLAAVWRRDDVSMAVKTFVTLARQRLPARAGRG